MELTSNMTLPTETMEERFYKKFPSLTGIKVTPRYGDDFRKAKLLQQYYDNLEKDLLVFIESELSLSQNRILEEVIEQVIDEIMKLPRVLVDVRMSPEDSHQYEPAVEIRDISLLRSRFKLITKKDN